MGKNPLVASIGTHAHHESDKLLGISLVVLQITKDSDRHRQRIEVDRHNGLRGEIVATSILCLPTCEARLRSGGYPPEKRIYMRQR